MRPDQHKSKESRKYQARKKQSGDSSASEVAEARRRAAKARDRGEGMAAIRRRNGDWVESEEEKEERKLRQAKFSKRKIESNLDRYEEQTEQEALERDAELGIDRETTDLVDLLESTEEGTSTFFKFKEEQSASQLTMLALDFQALSHALESYDTVSLLGLEADEALVRNALEEHPVILDKPIVPAFSKNAKGYVLFKSQPIKPNLISEADGIYLRNDGSNHRLSKNNTSVPENDDLDELLALDQKAKPTAPTLIKPTTVLPKPGSIKKSTASVKQPAQDTDNVPAAPTPIKPTTALPKPGSIKKSTVSVKQPAQDADDEAWLDDLLG